jgi:ATP-binding cassette subfamily G (WHITE) protein 2
MGMLTVRENISFAASLKLPQHTSDNVRKERVNQVIEELGLTACAETRVSASNMYKNM